jgi:hypothetical protein
VAPGKIVPSVARGLGDRCVKPVTLGRGAGLCGRLAEVASLEPRALPIMQALPLNTMSVEHELRALPGARAG